MNTNLKKGFWIGVGILLGMITLYFACAFLTFLFIGLGG